MQVLGLNAETQRLLEHSNCMHMLLRISGVLLNEQQLLAGGSMAGSALFLASSSRDYHYSRHATLFVVLACITAATGGLIFGFDLGISGGVTAMDDFLLTFFPKVYRQRHSAKTDNYCKFNSQVLTAFTSSLYLAGLVTSLFAATFTSRYGRRASIMTGGICFVVGSVLNAAAQDLAMLLLGRIMLGIGLGFTNQSVPLYLSEVAPPRLRGGLNGLNQVALGLGVFVAFLVNYGTSNIVPWGWRLSLGSSIIPSTVILIGALFLPDSPNSLIQRGYLDKGRAILEKMRGTVDVQAEFDDLLEASETCKEVKHPWRTILERRYRPELVMAFAIPFFQQFTGINIITFYAPVLFQTLGLGSNASLYSAVILGGVALGAAIAASLVVDGLGRRALLFNGSVVMVVTLIIVAVILDLKLGAHNDLPRREAIVVVVTVCIYVAAFGWSWGPVGVLVPSEIFPLEIRSAGQSINVCVVFFFIFAGAQLFLAMLCRMKAGLFVFFAAWQAMAALFVYALLPETKKVPLEAIAELWKLHPVWRRFSSPPTQ